MYYVVKAKKSPKDQSVSYYAQAAKTRSLNLADVAERITQNCTVTEHDVKAVLSALQEQIILALREGFSVRLGDLGSFRPTICSLPSATAEEVTAKNVKSVRVRFTQGSRLRAGMALTNSLMRMQLWTDGQSGDSDTEIA